MRYLVDDLIEHSSMTVTGPQASVRNSSGGSAS
jgi:hypothetical protein